MPSPKYNHAFTLAFECLSDHKEGEDVTPAMLREAISRRMDKMDAASDPAFQWKEAVGAPFDTMRADA